MNLESKAKKYSSEMVSEGEHVLNEQELKRYCEDDYSAGYNECKADIIDFLQANQKATVKQVLEHLNGMK